MAKAYSKQDIIGAYLYRFMKVNVDASSLVDIAEAHYDKVGKDEFRKYASVDAAAMREYFSSDFRYEV